MGDNPFNPWLWIHVSCINVYPILKPTIPVQRRLQQDHLNNRSANMTAKHKPSFIMSFLLYAESNQEIVLNVQFIIIFPLIAF